MSAPCFLIAAVQFSTTDSGVVTLGAAAVAAVRQWRYARTVVKGAPVSVITTVALTFSLKSAQTHGAR